MRIAGFSSLLPYFLGKSAEIGRGDGLSKANATLGCNGAAERLVPVSGGSNLRGSSR